jgi:hypothetical protein
MGVTIVRYSERPALWERIADLSAEVWPEYNRHGAVLNTYWDRLYDRFPEYQFVLYDDEHDEVLAEGQTIPCAWDGAMSTLGPGIDDTMINALRCTTPVVNRMHCARSPPRFRRVIAKSAWPLWYSLAWLTLPGRHTSAV